MALINCPECDREISDRVIACPHCGFPLKEEIKSDEDLKPQNVQITGVKVEKRKVILYILVPLLILSLIAGAYFIYNGIKVKKEKAAYQAAFNEYVDTANLISIKMLLNGSSAENITNLLARVWRNTIYEESDPTTDMYTKSSSYKFHDDFNVAIDNFYQDYKISRQVKDLKSGQISVSESMKELQNPPEGLEKVYDAIMDLNLAYRQLTNLAISPTGSLTSFSDAKNKAQSNFLDQYERLKNLIPEKFPVPENSDK
jgi:hypothetical protein